MAECLNLSQSADLIRGTADEDGIFGRFTV
jgi:hypothetical protein